MAQQSNPLLLPGVDLESRVARWAISTGISESLPENLDTPLEQHLFRPIHQALAEDLTDPLWTSRAMKKTVDQVVSILLFYPVLVRQCLQNDEGRRIGYSDALFGQTLLIEKLHF